MTEREQQIREMIARRAEAQASNPEQAEAIASPGVIENIQQIEVKTFDKQQETYSTDIVPEIARAVPRGVIESLKNATVNISRMIGLEGSEKELSPFFTGLLENTQKPKTTVGKIVQDITGFASSYATLRGIGTASSTTGKFAQASARGATVDFLIWDKDDGRLSDVLSDAGIQNIVVDYLKTDKSDSDFERNLKNALEGAAAGTVSEVVFRSIAQGYKLTKAMFTKKGQPIPDNEVIMPSTVKEAEQVIEEVPKIVKETKPGVEIPIDTSTVKQGNIPPELTPPDSFVNYTKLEGVDEEQIKILEGLTSAEDYAKWIETGAKPQSLTKEEANLYAKAVGEDWQEFAVADIKNLKGQDSKLIYYKQVMYGKLKEMSSLVKNFNIDDMDDRLKLTKLYQELAVASGAMKKIQMEAARTTAAGRINIIPRETLDAIEEAVSMGTIDPKAFDKIISKATATRIHKELEKVLDINTDVSLHRATLALNKEDGAFTKLVRALVEVRTAGILSSPVSHGINIMGNTLVRSVAKVEDILAWGIGKAFNTKDRLLFDEMTATYQGKVTSSLDTLRGLGNAITKSGFDPKKIEDSLEDSYLDNYVKYDTAASKGVSSDYLMNITEDSSTIAKGFGTAIDVAGAAVRVPFHALGVVDDMFKRSIYNGQISYIATREANKLGLKGEDKAKYISEFMYTHKLVFAKKTSEFTAEQKPLVQKYIVENQGGFHKEALETARELTFQEEIRTGQGASRLNKTLGWLDNIRNVHPAGNIIVPFYVTPVNLLKWIGRRTPLTFAASSRMIDDLKAGGRRRNLAISRLTVGTSLYAAGGFLANEGILIGGSKDYKEAEGKKIAGLQDYSIKIGNKIIELNRFDPLVTPLMLGADLAKLHSEMVARGYGDLDGYQEKYDEAMAAVITSVSNNVFNKLWLKSVSDLVDAAMRQDAKYFERTLASFAPYSSASRFMEQQETIKEANGVVENLYKIYAPYLLEDALDVFGKPIKDTKMYGLKSSEITESPVRREIARLKIPISKFDNIISYKGTDLELEPEDHRKVQRYVNTIFKLEDRLNVIVNSPVYKNASVRDGIDTNITGTRKKLIMDAIANARNKAIRYYLSKHKDEFLEKYKERIDALENTNDAIMQKWLERNE